MDIAFDENAESQEALSAMISNENQVEATEE
jgi:hypothetical protein